jgi:hypothetical protein
MNTCERVGASSHIPKLLGTWELSTIILGKCVSQARQVKERKSIWFGTTVLDSQVFVHESK